MKKMLLKDYIIEIGYTYGGRTGCHSDFEVYRIKAPNKDSAISKAKNKVKEKLFYCYINYTEVK